MPAPHRRVLGDPPSIGADFDATPKLIRQIEVDQAVVLGESDRDLALRTIELGLRRRSETVWVPGTLRVVMAALRHMPRPLFRRLPM